MIRAAHRPTRPTHPFPDSRLCRSGSALSLYTTRSVPDPASPTVSSNVLALFGYAPNIQPEKATTWTAGFDIAPSSMPGFKASLTYFDVDYRDRIGTLTEDYLRFLTNRDVFGGVEIGRDTRLNSRQ